MNKNLMHNNILNGIEEVNRFVSIYIQVDYMSMKKLSIHNHKWYTHIIIRLHSFLPKLNHWVYKTTDWQTSQQTGTYLVKHLKIQM